MKIGLTGGMGCGKSTVMQILAQSGFEPVETDRVAKELLDQSEEVQAELKKHFGSGIFDAKGKVDRRQLASRVFSDSKELSLLESILHPRVRDVWFDAIQNSSADYVVEIPLLFEKNLQSSFDLILCVASSPEKQQERLIENRGLTPKEISERVDKQLPIEEKIKRADVVFINDGSMQHLEDQVYLFLRSIQSQRNHKNERST